MPKPNSDEQLKAKLNDAFTEHFNQSQGRGVGAAAGKVNIQALIAAIMQLIAAFTGGNTPAPPQS